MVHVVKDHPRTVREYRVALTYEAVAYLTVAHSYILYERLEEGRLPAVARCDAERRYALKRVWVVAEELLTRFKGKI